LSGVQRFMVQAGSQAHSHLGWNKRALQDARALEVGDLPRLLRASFRRLVPSMSDALPFR
jgi:hypothetical protein